MMKPARVSPRTSAIGAICRGRKARAPSGTTDRRGGDVLAIRLRRIDRRPAADDRRELLGALVADILELGDADVLDAWVAWAPGRAWVIDRRGLDRVECGLGERAGGGPGLRDLVGRAAGGRRNRRPSGRDPRPRLLDVLRPGRPRDIPPG